MQTSLEKTRRLVNLCLSIGILGLGSAGLVWLVWSKPGPERRLTAKRLPSVEVLRIRPVVFDSPVIGYGTVRPKRQIKIIPEVSGRLIHVHDQLAVGNVIGKGELLFEIDAQAYELKVRQVQAEIRRLEVQLRRYEQQKVNVTQRLALAQRQEELAKESVDRERRLLGQQSGTALELESAEERHLRHQQGVLASRSELALIPLYIEETNALLETKRAQGQRA